MFPPTSLTPDLQGVPRGSVVCAKFRTRVCHFFQHFFGHSCLWLQPNCKGAEKCCGPVGPAAKCDKFGEHTPLALPQYHQVTRFYPILNSWLPQPSQNSFKVPSNLAAATSQSISLPSPDPNSGGLASPRLPAQSLPLPPPDELLPFLCLLQCSQLPLHWSCSSRPFVLHTRVLKYTALCSEGRRCTKKASRQGFVNGNNFIKNSRPRTRL